MSEEQKTLAEVEAHIATLPAAQQERVRIAVRVLEDYMRLAGEDGALAIALVGARMAASA